MLRAVLCTTVVHDAMHTNVNSSRKFQCCWVYVSFRVFCCFYCGLSTVLVEKSKGSPYSITERRVPEPIPVLGSQLAGGVSHNLGGRLPLLSARHAVTLATLERAATSFAAW